MGFGPTTITRSVETKEGGARMNLDYLSPVRWEWRNGGRKVRLDWGTTPGSVGIGPLLQQYLDVLLFEHGRVQCQRRGQ